MLNFKQAFPLTYRKHRQWGARHCATKTHSVLHQVEQPHDPEKTTFFESSSENGHRPANVHFHVSGGYLQIIGDFLVFFSLRTGAK